MADKKRSKSKPVPKPATGAAGAKPSNRVISAPQQSKTPLFVTAAVVVLALVVLIIVLSSGNDKTAATSTVAPGVTGDTLVANIAAIPSTAYDTAGAGEAKSVFKKITSDAITKDGKPEVLFIGAEFCPYCAAERWAMAASLSRFGTLSGAGLTRSAASDGDIATLTFKGISYTSKYIAFTSVESLDRDKNPLETPTADQTKLWTAINGSQSWPFLDVGGKYAIATTFDPNTLSRFSQAEIAALMSDPTTPIGKTILGASNQFTATICSLTGNQPSDVCDSAGVKAAIAALPTK